MRETVLLRAFVLGLFGLSTITALAGPPGPTPQQGYAGPRCIAGFCFGGPKRILEGEIVSRYGKSETSSGVYCYHVQDQGLFVRFETDHAAAGEIIEIFVSTKRNCLASFSETVPPKARFPRFETAEGVRLGDSEGKVVATYGPPTLVERGTGLELRGLQHEKALKSEPFGKKVLIYSARDDELLTSAFYINDGKVAAILLSANE